MEWSCHVKIYDSDEQLRVCTKVSVLVHYDLLPQLEELGNSAKTPCRPALNQTRCSPECCAS